MAYSEEEFPHERIAESLGAREPYVCTTDDKEGTEPCEEPPVFHTCRSDQPCWFQADTAQYIHNLKQGG